LDGTVVTTEVTAIPFDLDGVRAIQVIMRDISGRLKAEADRRRELYDYIIEQAVNLTESTMGFFHQVSEDQKTILLTTWNREALKGCMAAYNTHYPLSDAGNWVDCVHQKGPVVYNDFAKSPNQKGLPGGHAPLYRFMSIPVIEDGLVRIIFGVGNKKSDYDETDVSHIQLVANELHRIMLQRRAEDRMHLQASLLDQIGDMVTAIDLEGRITYLNDAQARAAGVAAGELLGRSLEKLGGILGLDAGHRGIIDATREQGSWHGEVIIRDVLRRELFMDVRTSAVFDEKGASMGMISVMTDITGRKAAEAALEDSEERYRGIFEGASQGIITVDLETGRFRIVNPAMCGMFGYTAEEFTELGIADLHPQEALEEVLETFKLMAQGKLFAITDIHCVSKDGIPFFADVSVSLVNFGGRRHLLGFFTESTERMKSQKLLRESEERYRSLIENSHDLIQSVDADGRIIFVNKAWLDTMEYGMNDLETIRLFDIVHPDSLEHCAKEFRHVLEGGTMEHIELVFLTRSGRAIDLEGNVVSHVRADGTVITNAFFSEITERKRDELVKLLRLSASDMLSRNSDLDMILTGLCRTLVIVSSLDFGEVWWIDRDSEHMKMRLAWSVDEDRETMEFLEESKDITFGYGEGMPGKVWSGKKTEIFNDIAHHPEFIRSGLADRLGVSSVVGIPVKDQDHVYGAILLFGKKQHVPKDFLQNVYYEIGQQTGDYIARKNLEADLELERRDLARRVDERTAELRSAGAAAEAASKAKSDFLASMSHELRTPLNSIIGFSEVMLGGLTGDMTAEQKEYLDDIYTSGRHLLSLINDILDLSKVEAGKMELQAGPMSIGEVMRTTMMLFREKTLKHGISFSADIQVEEKDDLVMADERKIKQVLFNLVSNAVKFTSDGGAVSIMTAKVAAEGKHFIEFSVSDTGIGISTADHEILFKPFIQIDNTSTRNYGGTGLGLSICKSFVELHGGTIRLESEEGMGSTFIFTLPLIKTEYEEDGES
jgi:PAS domain S-box-containing protein